MENQFQVAQTTRNHPTGPIGGSNDSELPVVAADAAASDNTGTDETLHSVGNMTSTYDPRNLRLPSDDEHEDPTDVGDDDEEDGSDDLQGTDVNDDEDAY